MSKSILGIGLLLALSVWLLPISTHAQSFDTDVCTNLTTKQQQRIKFISYVVEKSDVLAARILDADPGASALLSQRLQERNRQLGSECNYRQLDRYIRTMVMDILSIQKSYKAQQTLTSNPAAEQAMILLQQQLLSIVWADQVKQLNKPVAISSDAGLTVNVNIPQMGKASMNITIGTKGQFDLQKGHFDTNIKANAMMSLEQFMETTKLSVKALWDIDVTNIDDLYVRINTLSFEGTTSDLEQQLMMDYAKTMVNQVSQTLVGKSINLTATGSSTGSQEYQYNQGISMSTALTQIIKQQADSYEMLNIMQKTPMMKFYRQENGVYYGSFNPDLCMLSTDISTQQSCLAQMTKMLYDADGYGPVAVQMNNGENTLALSDTHIDDKMSDDILHLNNKPIIYRNNQKLTKIEVPFNPAWTSKLLYTNPDFMLVVQDPEVDLSITGTISAQGINLNGKGIFQDGYRGTMSRKSVFQPVSSSSVSTNTTDIEINGYQEASQLFDVSVNSTQTVDPTSNRPIQAPSMSITLENAMQLLQPILNQMNMLSPSN